MERLRNALERMRHTAFWETLIRLHKQAQSYSEEIASLRTVKRFNPKFAAEQIAEVEQLRAAVINATSELLDHYNQAENDIRRERPELLGELPIVDGLTLSSLIPAEYAAKVKGLLGRYLQGKQCSIGRAYSLVAECYMALNNLLPGPVDDRLKPDKLSRLLELHEAYLNLVDSGFMNTGGDFFATHAVEYKSVVASSNARLIAEFSWRAIEKVLELGSGGGVLYDRCGRHISQQQIDELKAKPSQELSKAAAIVSQDELEKVWELFQVEVELAEKSASKPVTNVVSSQPVQPKVLTDNDRELLQAMFELQAFADFPKSNEQILKKAGWISDGKRAYKNVINCGYVGSKRGVGYFLTDSGTKKAQQISGRT